MFSSQFSQFTHHRMNLKTEADKKEGILLKVQRTPAKLVHHNGHGYVNIARGEEF